VKKKNEMQYLLQTHQMMTSIIKIIQIVSWNVAEMQFEIHDESNDDLRLVI